MFVYLICLLSRYYYDKNILTKIAGKRYAYRFDFHALQLACEAQQSPTPSDTKLTELTGILAPFLSAPKPSSPSSPQPKTPAFSAPSTPAYPPPSYNASGGRTTQKRRYTDPPSKTPFSPPSQTISPFSPSTQPPTPFSPSSRSSFSPSAQPSFLPVTSFSTESPFGPTSDPPSFSSFESQYNSSVISTVSDYVPMDDEYVCDYRYRTQPPSFDSSFPVSDLNPSACYSSTAEVCSSALYLDLEETWNQEFWNSAQPFVSAPDLAPVSVFGSGFGSGSGECGVERSNSVPADMYFNQF